MWDLATRRFRLWLLWLILGPRLAALERLTTELEVKAAELERSSEEIERRTRALREWRRRP